MNGGADGLAVHRIPDDRIPDGRPAADRTVASGVPGLHWWREVGMVLAFYLVYSLVRNTQGSDAVAGEAMANAVRLIRLEQATGLFFERAVQQAFLGYSAFIGFWNLLYGTLHFVDTIGVLIVLFHRHPERYRRWRTVLAVTTGLALIGFAGYPLMPPRLLPASYGFVDTLALYGSPWSFESAPVNSVSNQYAAMPSLHFAWAAWCTCALLPVLHHRWSRSAMAAYPAVTLFAVVVTGNHYVLDAAAGAAVLAVGFVVTRAVGGQGARHGGMERAGSALARS